MQETRQAARLNTKHYTQIDKMNQGFGFILSAGWFALAAFLTERCFWLIIGKDPGLQWAGMLSAWSFIFGGLLGRQLLRDNISKRTILLIGVGVPCLALYASSVAFALGPAALGLFGDSPMDSVKQIILSPILGLVVAASGLLVTFWLVLPIGIAASWALAKVGKMRRSKERV